VTNAAMQDNRNISFRTLVIVRFPYCGPPPLLDAGDFNARKRRALPQLVRMVARRCSVCCCDCQAEKLIAASSSRLFLLSQLQPCIPHGQLCER
jgi:hypothetical protein